MHDHFSYQRVSLGWQSSIIIHDNARPHISQHTTDFLNGKCATVWNQPPYSPDFNLLDRWLFSLLEKKRYRQNFGSRGDLYCALFAIEKSSFHQQGERLLADLSAVVHASGGYLHA